jgi:MFS family permease
MQMQTSQSKMIQLSLLLLATLGVMSGIAIVASLPNISKEFTNIPDIEFLSKLMLTVPSIIIAFFAPISGWIVDRYGRLKPLYIGFFLFIIGGSSGLYLDNFYAILAGRAVLGVAVALLMTSSTALIGDYFDEEERHRFMSLQGMTVGLGGIVFITLGGFLAQVHWSYPFAIYLIPLLFFPILYKNLYEPKVTKHLVGEGEVPEALWPVYLTAFFSMVIFYMMPTQLPFLIINKLGGEPLSVGLVISTAMLFNAFTSRQYAKVKKRFSFLHIYMFTFIFFGIGLFIISKASSIGDIYFSTLFIGMGFGLILVNTNAWFLSKVHASKRGRASGILASSFFLGQFASPLIFKPVVDEYGIQGLFFLISMVSLSISLVIFLRLIRTGREERGV